MHCASTARGNAPVLHLYWKASAVHTYMCMYAHGQYVIEQNSSLLRPSPERCLHLHARDFGDLSEHNDVQRRIS